MGTKYGVKKKYKQVDKNVFVKNVFVKNTYDFNEHKKNSKNIISTVEMIITSRVATKTM